MPKELDNEEKLYMRKVQGRDTGKKTFARFCDTISIFQYQGAVFLAQWTLVSANECEYVDG